MDIEIPDNEDAACDLSIIAPSLAGRGLYGAAEICEGAARRLRADAEEIARLEAKCAEQQRALEWYSVGHCEKHHTEIARLESLLASEKRLGEALNNESNERQAALEIAELQVEALRDAAADLLNAAMNPKREGTEYYAKVLNDVMRSGGEAQGLLEDLRARIEELEAENERLKAWWSHPFKPGCSSQGWELQCSVTAPDGLRHCGYAPEYHPLDAQVLKLRDTESENERLRKGIVWAVKHCTLTRSYDGRHYVNVPSQAKSYPYDGTDAGLIEAVMRAMGEG